MKYQRKDLQIFTEIGYGNRFFVSTEIERGNREKRVRGCVRFKVTGLYWRIWIGYQVFILSTRNGFETTRKSTKRFKIIFGLSGHP